MFEVRILIFFYSEGVKENTSGDRLALLQEVEANKRRLESLGTKIAELEDTILRAEAKIVKSEKSAKISETRERIDLVEARISSAKSVTFELAESIATQRKVVRRVEPNVERTVERLRQKIEAQLMVNLM